MLKNERKGKKEKHEPACHGMLLNERPSCALVDFATLMWKGSQNPMTVGLTSMATNEIALGLVALVLVHLERIDRPKSVFEGRRVVSDIVHTTRSRAAVAGKSLAGPGTAECGIEDNGMIVEVAV